MGENESESSVKLQQYQACMLSILDTLKLHDNSCSEDNYETLSEIMFRKMRVYDIDLNEDLGFEHLKPVVKKLKHEPKHSVGEIVELVPNHYGESGLLTRITEVLHCGDGNFKYHVGCDKENRFKWIDRDFV